MMSLSLPPDPDLGGVKTGHEIIASHWPATVHPLKTVPPYFDHVASFEKPFEVRRNDRSFQPGDLLVLREWIPANHHDTGYFTDRQVLRKVTYVLRDGETFGVQAGFVVLGLAHVNAEDWRPGRG